MSSHLYQPRNELTFVTVPGEVDQLFRVLQTDDSIDELHIDLSHVTRCDSAGLALLIETKRRCIASNKLFVVVAIPKTIMTLAAFCGVQKLLTPDSSVDKK